MLDRAIGLGLAMLFATSASAAGINMQVYGGSRTTAFVPKGEFSSDDSSDPSAAFSNRYTGTEYGVASLAQPVKELPVAIGLFAMEQQFKGHSSNYEEKLSGIMAGVDAMTWMTEGIWQPFVRLGYDLYSRHRYSATYQDTEMFGVSHDPVPTHLEMDGHVHGYHGAFGARIKPTPFVGAFMQIDFANEQMVVDRASVLQDGFGFTASAGDFPKIDLKSRSLMIGMDLGT